MVQDKLEVLRARVRTKEEMDLVFSGGVAKERM